MKRNLQNGSSSSELQHHFHQYFELLLGVEKERLMRAVATASTDGTASFRHDIDERFAYLRGAVRMGRLLGLISDEEAKMKHQLLTTQRAHLHSNFAGDLGELVKPSTNGSSPHGREHLKRLMKMVTDRSEPPTECEAA